MPRAYFAAAALGGQVYVVGGNSSEGVFLDSAERFTPGWGYWETLPPMQAARAALSAAAVPGRLWVVGGSDESSVHSSAECFDPKADVWQRLPSMRRPRWAAASAALDGRLFVMGGNGAADEALAATECFLPAASSTDGRCGSAAEGEWCELPALRTARASTSAAAVGGRIYVVGGYNETQDLASLECFDPAFPDQWHQLTPMHAPRFSAEAVACAGSLYVLGGSVGVVDRASSAATLSHEVLGTVERYDPKANRWRPVSTAAAPLTLLRPRRRFGAVSC